MSQIKYYKYMFIQKCIFSTNILGVCCLFLKMSFNIFKRKWSFLRNWVNDNGTWFFKFTFRTEIKLILDHHIIGSSLTYRFTLTSLVLFWNSSCQHWLTSPSWWYSISLLCWSLFGCSPFSLFFSVTQLFNLPILPIFMHAFCDVIFLLYWLFWNFKFLLGFLLCGNRFGFPFCTDPLVKLCQGFFASRVGHHFDRTSCLRVSCSDLSVLNFVISPWHFSVCGLHSLGFSSLFLGIACLFRWLHTI